MNIIEKNNSIKDYYINLQTLYNNAIKLLTGINQSLSTSASEVTITVADTNNEQSTVRIPSFLYLENKLEQLDSNFGTLFNLPKSGEAWFNNSNGMYKIEMVKSNTSPIKPQFNTTDLYSYTKYNNLFKDLVNPKTYLKLNIDNLPNNIEEMFMKKMIFHNVSIYNNLLSSGYKSYNDIKNALYGFIKGVDYDEYDSIIKLPLKNDEFISEFKILEIPELNESNNPWTPIDDVHHHLHYKLRLNTIKYFNNEDNSITYSLKIGDYITLENENVIYKIVNIESNINSLSEYLLEIEEITGHITLQTFNENHSMVMKLYTNDQYNKFHYVELPLEENEYICLFIGTVYNNIRSIMSDGILLDLNSILMKDENGNLIYDTNSKTPMTYIQYYDKYCKNVGDLMLGFIETTYPQLSNYNNEQLNTLQNSDEVKNLVSKTINSTSILKVQKINNHLLDDTTTENILKLHTEKSELNIQLQNVQNNINETYNQLVTTDFSQDISVSQESLKLKLDEYYAKRRTLQNQQISIVDNINILKGNVKSMNNSKFRIRGNADVTEFEKYIKSSYKKCEIIGLEVQYKYKSINSDTTNVSVINSTVYTDWNRTINIDKERKLVFDENNNYSIKYENYDTVNNIIKWNQIDIPITQGEDVVIRIRYKYSIGQPFINLYTPWSDEITVTFPAELTETNEISSILDINDTDTTSAKFNNTLINEGYQEHINNKIIDGSQSFYHMPENIYSGFNTAENKLISLKDKLNTIVQDIESYKQFVNDEINSEYKVFLEYDNISVEISNNTENNITLNYNNDADIQNDLFIRKDMNLVIKNTGTSNIKMYSLFPGNISMPLLLTNEQFYDKYIIDYERVPLLYGNSQIPHENIYFQKLGQWIYFRQNNAYSKRDYYDNNKNINSHNLNSAVRAYEFLRDEGDKYFGDLSEETQNKYSCKFATNGDVELSNKEYLRHNNKQVLLGYRSRSNNISLVNSTQLWRDVIYDRDSRSYRVVDLVMDYNENIIKDPYNNFSEKFFLPFDVITDTTNGKEYYHNNNYLLCYEHICKVETEDNNVKTNVYLTPSDSLSLVAQDPNYLNFNNTDDFCGAFFIPKLLTKKDLLCDRFEKNQYKELTVGKSFSIPIIFEYYLKDSLKSVSKTIAFDLKTSTIKEPDHYAITIKANYKLTSSINIDYSEINDLEENSYEKL